MKQLKQYLIIAFATLGLITASFAQDAKPVNTVVSAVKSSGLLSATNYAFEPYATYAPNLKTKIGGGVLAIYNVNDYLGAGLGIDWLGQFSLVSGNATLKLPINAGEKAKHYIPALPDFVTNVVVTPFALAGLGTPLSGAGGNCSTIEDIGAYVQIGHLSGGKFNLGACWGQWNNAGEYSGKRYHIFAGWSKGF